MPPSPKEEFFNENAFNKKAFMRMEQNSIYRSPHAVL